MNRVRSKDSFDSPRMFDDHNARNGLVDCDSFAPFFFYYDHPPAADASKFNHWTNIIIFAFVKRFRADSNNFSMKPPPEQLFIHFGHLRKTMRKLRVPALLMLGLAGGNGQTQCSNQGTQNARVFIHPRHSFRIASNFVTRRLIFESSFCFAHIIHGRPY